MRCTRRSVLRTAGMAWVGRWDSPGARRPPAPSTAQPWRPCRFSYGLWALRRTPRRSRSSRNSWTPRSTAATRACGRCGSGATWPEPWPRSSRAHPPRCCWRGAVPSLRGPTGRGWPGVVVGGAAPTAARPCPPSGKTPCGRREDFPGGGRSAAACWWSPRFCWPFHDGGPAGRPAPLRRAAGRCRAPTRGRSSTCTSRSWAVGDRAIDTAAWGDSGGARSRPWSASCHSRWSTAWAPFRCRWPRLPGDGVEPPDRPGGPRGRRPARGRAA